MTVPRTAPRLTGLRATLLTVTATTVAVLPVWLTGGLSVFMAPDLRFDEQQLGFSVAGFFLASALASVPGGRLAERVGPRLAMLMPILVTFGSLIAIGWAVTSWPLLVAVLLLAGAANGVLHPAANLRLAREVSSAHRALAFGIKQSAIPAATLLAGLAVPAVGLTLGWRQGFLGAALLALLVGAVALRGAGGAGPSIAPPPRLSTGWRPLIVLTVAAGLGSGAANAMAAFLIPSMVASGMAPRHAGALLVGASLGCIAMRVFIGWRADHRTGGHLRVVALLLATGCAGYVLLAWVEAPVPVLAVGAVLAFTAGWGWAGLFNFAVVERNPEGPAAATGVTQVGIFSGAVVGPSVFGTLVVSSSYTVAWLVMAASGLVAAVLVAATRPSLAQAAA